MSDMADSEDHGPADEIFALGAEITGGVVGAGIGTVVAGPPGAVVGAVTGPVVTRIAKQVVSFAARQLSRHEKRRLGAVARYTYAYLEREIAAGRAIREDGFFEEAPDGRIPIDEAAEGVFRVARDENEERKLPYLGRLLAEIALNPMIDRSTAATMTREVQELTYRQLMLLALFSRSAEFDLRQDSYRMKPLSNIDPVIPLLTDIANLTRRGLAAVVGDTVVGIKDAIPSIVEPFGLGVWLVNAMDLRSVPTTELEPLVSALKRDEE
jgi:hypothetical protein